ncbi:hypothetical protein TNCV_3350211 [Trichonephila clavipes]|nr:hypothetical protein TNCV_3350211 [Trichonephila clavipes]
MDFVILNHGQVTRMTPELALPPPNFHTTPMGRSLNLDISSAYRPPLHGFCDGPKEQASNNDGVKTKTTALPHPPYSPDLASCNFRIFPELERRFQAHRIEFADKIKSASQAELKGMTKNGFQKCFDDLYK